MSVLRVIVGVLKINWVKTLICNFKYLDLNKAYRFPILVYRSCHFSGKGKIILKSDRIVMGMIKLGIKHESCCISSQGIHIKNEGRIIFEGSGVIGNGDKTIWCFACWQKFWYYWRFLASLSFRDFNRR